MWTTPLNDPLGKPSLCGKKAPCALVKLFLKGRQAICSSSYLPCDPLIISPLVTVMQPVALVQHRTKFTHPSWAIALHFDEVVIVKSWFAFFLFYTMGLQFVSLFKLIARTIGQIQQRSRFSRSLQTDVFGPICHTKSFRYPVTRCYNICYTIINQQLSLVSLTPDVSSSDAMVRLSIFHQ